MEEINKNGFVKFHLPCPLCSSSDAVSVNKDGSAYCFSCQEYIHLFKLIYITNYAKDWENSGGNIRIQYCNDHKEKKGSSKCLSTNSVENRDFSKLDFSQNHFCKE